MNPLVPMIASTVVAATPLIYAALGETVVERSGVLNLGIEGMMLIGAVAGFAATRGSGSDAVGFLAAAAAGVALSLVFGFLTLNLQTNQVATGLALTLFGIGLSAFVGHNLAGLPVRPAGADQNSGPVRHSRPGRPFVPLRHHGLSFDRPVRCRAMVPDEVPRGI